MGLGITHQLTRTRQGWLQIWDLGSRISDSPDMAAHYIGGCQAVLLVYDGSRQEVSGAAAWALRLCCVPGVMIRAKHGPLPHVRHASGAGNCVHAVHKAQQAGGQARRQIGSGAASLPAARRSESLLAAVPRPQSLDAAAAWLPHLHQMYAGSGLPYLALVGQKMDVQLPESGGIKARHAVLAAQHDLYR
jgi:hypothetical protein